MSEEDRSTGAGFVLGLILAVVAAALLWLALRPDRPTQPEQSAGADPVHVTRAPNLEPARLTPALTPSAEPSAPPAAEPSPIALGQIETTLVDDERGARCTVRGKVSAGIPDGVCLHATLETERRKLAVFQVVVDDQSFDGGWSWPRRHLAPRRYTARVELLMDAQRTRLTEELRRRFDWPDGHVALIDDEQLRLGSEEEAGAFAVSERRELLELAAALDALLAEAQVDPDARLGQRLIGLQDRLREFEQAFVHRSGLQPRERLEAAAARLAWVLEAPAERRSTTTQLRDRLAELQNELQE